MRNERMKTSLSIVIPVYNAEKSLPRCLDSIVCQSLENVEILLINDGSTDGSAAICGRYASLWPQIVYVEQPNGGVSSARNAGLDAAKGTYVLFVDSDDYVPASLLSGIDRELQDGDWDLIRFSYCVDNGKTKREIRMSPASCRSREEALPRIIDDVCSKALNSPWAKVYRRAIIERERIRFPLGASIAEDRAFNIKYSMYVRQYRVSDQLGYFVNTENEQSLSRKPQKDLSAQFAVTGEYVLQAIRQAPVPDSEKEAYRRAVNFGVCRSVYKEAKDLHKDRMGWCKRQQALWKSCRAVNKKHMRYPATKYCRRIALPVRTYQTWLIDLAAKKLNGKQ